jgi:GNAT superfamily N-acetyltransferase
MNEPLTRPILLNRTHDITQFDCDTPQLNVFLKSYALQNINNSSARTYVTSRGNRVVGYYSLAYGSISHAEANIRMAKGLAKHPIPIILLARLAVDKTEKGRGLGRALLKDALLRTLQAAEIGGLRAILVHAKDESAKNFYEKFGFEPLEINPLHLYLLMKDLAHVFTSLASEPVA